MSRYVNTAPFHMGYGRPGKFGIRTKRNGTKYGFVKRYVPGRVMPFSGRLVHKRVWSAKSVPYYDKYKKASTAQKAWRAKYLANHRGRVA